MVCHCKFVSTTSLGVHLQHAHGSSSAAKGSGKADSGKGAAKTSSKGDGAKRSSKRRDDDRGSSAKGGPAKGKTRRALSCLRNYEMVTSCLKAVPKVTQVHFKVTLSEIHYLYHSKHCINVVQLMFNNCDTIRFTVPPLSQMCYTMH